MTHTPNEGESSLPEVTDDQLLEKVLEKSEDVQRWALRYPHAPQAVKNLGKELRWRAAKMEHVQALPKQFRTLLLEFLFPELYPKQAKAVPAERPALSDAARVLQEDTAHRIKALQSDAAGSKDLKTQEVFPLPKAIYEKLQSFQQMIEQDGDLSAENYTALDRLLETVPNFVKSLRAQSKTNGDKFDTLANNLETIAEDLRQALARLA